MQVTELSECMKIEIESADGTEEIHCKLQPEGNRCGPGLRWFGKSREGDFWNIFDHGEGVEIWRNNEKLKWRAEHVNNTSTQEAN